MLANVEFAYWNLYNAYWNLYANEAALRQAYEAWKIAEVKLQAGKIAVADVAQARGQYELFRNQRLAALGGTGNPASGGVRGVLEAGAPAARHPGHARRGRHAAGAQRRADPGRLPPRLGHRPDGGPATTPRR